MITETFRTNNLQSITTEVGTFQVEQRLIGFADNDGRWLVQQDADLYWRGGTLTERRPGKLLGIFSTVVEAEAAIRSAVVQPEHTPFHKSLN